MTDRSNSLLDRLSGMTPQARAEMGVILGGIRQIIAADSVAVDAGQAGCVEGGAPKSPPTIPTDAELREVVAACRAAGLPAIADAVEALSAENARLNAKCEQQAADALRNVVGWRAELTEARAIINEWEIAADEGFGDAMMGVAITPDWLRQQKREAAKALSEAHSTIARQTSEIEFLKAKVAEMEGGIPPAGMHLPTFRPACYIENADPRFLGPRIDVAWDRGAACGDAKTAETRRRQFEHTSGCFRCSRHLRAAMIDAGEWEAFPSVVTNPQKMAKP